MLILGRVIWTLRHFLLLSLLLPLCVGLSAQELSTPSTEESLQNSRETAQQLLQNIDNLLISLENEQNLQSELLTNLLTELKSLRQALNEVNDTLPLLEKRFVDLQKSYELLKSENKTLKEQRLALGITAIFGILGATLGFLF